jgi:hypothetical protein
MCHKGTKGNAKRSTRGDKLWSRRPSLRPCCWRYEKGRVCGKSIPGRDKSSVLKTKQLRHIPKKFGMRSEKGVGLITGLFCAVLAFELRAYTFSHSTIPFL